MHKHVLIAGSIPLLAALAVLHAAEDLTVLKPTADGVAPGKQFELWLKNEFYRQVDRRSAEFEKMIKSEAACRAWQKERREFFLRQIGGLPERSPLKGRVVGTL
ncbi:MAG: hypothetical protein FJ388_21605, partial [Verrucomicrobia bacterium]|nr:hypothetical protein [Verrucomicrobiota bacterium]